MLAGFEAATKRRVQGEVAARATESVTTRRSCVSLKAVALNVTGNNMLGNDGVNIIAATGIGVVVSGSAAAVADGFIG